MDHPQIVITSMVLKLRSPLGLPGGQEGDWGGHPKCLLENNKHQLHGVTVAVGCQLQYTELRLPGLRVKYIDHQDWGPKILLEPRNAIWAEVGHDREEVAKDISYSSSFLTAGATPALLEVNLDGLLFYLDGSELREQFKEALISQRTGYVALPEQDWLWGCYWGCYWVKHR